MDDNRLNEHSKQSSKSHVHGRWNDLFVRISIGVSILTFVLLICGFVYGAYVGFGGFTRHSNPAFTSNKAPIQVSKQNKAIHLIALGDSLTHGTGDASGLGFVGNVSNSYKQLGYHVVQSNLGIGGLTSNGLMEELKQPATENLLQSADLILISIGGNDLNGAAGLPNIIPAQITQAQDHFSTNLTTILSSIRKVNGSATIILVGLYNPFGDVPKTVRQTDTIVESWNLREEEIAAAFPRTVVVRTFDLFQLHPVQFLYGDHFHPNQAGYQRIAQRIWQDLQ